MIFTWGSTYYLLAILAEPIAADTGWGLGAITGALSVGLLVAGLISPLVGCTIDARGGRMVLAIGVGLIVCGLTSMALSRDLWVFWAAWFLLGLGMAAGLYDPAFATLGRLYGRGARRAITQLTLLGGLASTVCWPLSAWMLDMWGWRGVAFGYVAIHLCATLPLVLGLIPNARKRTIADKKAMDADASANPEEVRILRVFSTMQIIHGLIMVNISVWLFAFLQAQGLSQAAAVAIGALMGPAQVAARLLEYANRERHHPIWTLAFSIFVVAIGLSLLALDVGVAGLAIVLFGGGNGLYSIARGALPLALFGEQRYAIVVGQLARPWLIAQAAAPTLGALAIAQWGADIALIFLATLSIVNVFWFLVFWQMTKTVRRANT